LRKIFKSSKEQDPCDVVHTALQNVEASSCYTKIVVVFPAKQRRCEADKAIIYFGFHLRRAQAFDLFCVANDKNMPKLLVLKVSDRYNEISKELLETSINALKGH